MVSMFRSGPMKRLGLAVIVVGVAGMAMAGVTYYSRGDTNNGSV